MTAGISAHTIAAFIPLHRRNHAIAETPLSSHDQIALATAHYRAAFRENS
jgi:hypothetical protein